MPTKTVSKRESPGTKQIPLGEFDFIDLFAGIGGLRLAFERNGARCVMSSEWDRFAQETYEANFNEKPLGDITQIKRIPKHDILTAGFPCQPFSLAGVSKNNALGRDHGFAHQTQGTLFFEIVRILKSKKPKAFLLENVKNLQSHDGGNTFRVIKATLRELGYYIEHRVIDGKAVVPQHRERTYIVGFRPRIRQRNKKDFEFPDFSEVKDRPTLKSILDPEPDPKYTLSKKLWKYLQDYAAKHRAKGNGFGYGLVDPFDPANEDVTTRTLSARYHKDGSEILIDTGGRTPRRLTPVECKRLMGFPEEFKIPVSDTQAYRQFGNSVVVPIVDRIAAEVIAYLKNGLKSS